MTIFQVPGIMTEFLVGVRCATLGPIGFYFTIVVADVDYMLKFLCFTPPPPSF